LGSTGSSPYIRGTYLIAADLANFFRFIPVYTGNILLPEPLQLHGSVHPRIYGEHPQARICLPSKIGSSPYIRGTWRKPANTAGNTRFIPVYTGNIPLLPSSEGGKSVHPRIYGEHSWKVTLPNFKRGSSPYIRGTCNILVNQSTATRFIPVYTGNIKQPIADDQFSTVHPRIYGEHFPADASGLE